MAMDDHVAKLGVSVAEIREQLAKIDVRLEDTRHELADTRDHLTKIEVRLEDTRSEVVALKVEMHKGFAEMIKWMVGTAIVLGATGITVMTFVLNYASPRAIPAASAPVIIQLPAQPAPARP
jgi:uncharacterized membrane protein